MPDHRLAKTRSGYEDYVYQPPQSRAVQAVAAKWRTQYEPRELVFDRISPEALAVVEKSQRGFSNALSAWRASRVR